MATRLGKPAKRVGKPLPGNKMSPRSATGVKVKPRQRAGFVSSVSVGPRALPR